MKTRNLGSFASAVAIIALLNTATVHAKTAAAPVTAESLAGETLINTEFKFHNANPQEIVDFISKESGIKIFYAAPKEEKNSISMFAIPGPLTAADALHYLAVLGNFSLTYKADGAHLAPKTGKENKEPATGEWARIVEAVPFYASRGRSGMTVLVRYSGANHVPIFVLPYGKGKESPAANTGSDIMQGTGGCVRGFMMLQPSTVDELHLQMGDINNTFAVKFDGNDPFQPVKNLAQFKTAGQLWTYIVKLKARLSPERKDFNDYLLAMNAATADLLKRFPKDPLRWSAKLEDASVIYWMSDVGKAGFDPAKAVAELNEIAAAPDAAAILKSQAQFKLAQFSIKTGDDDSICKAVVAYHRDHAADWDDNTLLALISPDLQKLGDDEKGGLLDALIKSDDKEVSGQAEDIQREVTSAKRAAELTTKPLDLKFTATDGSEVDLSKMRGKVVLVDFWATWCGPCMGTAPHVVDAYKKYHDKGFEVVGVSLDQDKDRMQEVAKSKGMTWPQYFDGKGYKNEISASYGIHAIPVMWLVDKKGMVTPVVIKSADIAIEPMIEKMLAE